MEIILLPCKNELKNIYKAAFDAATRMYIVNAYLTEWDDDLQLNSRCSDFRLIVGTDFGITRKKALHSALQWCQHIKNAKLYISEIRGFHPKAVFWQEPDNKYYSIIGSSNLTQAAFSTNFEANIKTEISHEQFKAAQEWILKIQQPAIPATSEWINNNYEEAKQDHHRQPRISNGVLLAIPESKGKETEELIEARRGQMRDFHAKQPLLEQLFRKSAKVKNWTQEDNDTFYAKINEIWGYENNNRFQGPGWERQGKGSDFQEFCRSLTKILDAEAIDRDSTVENEIDRLHDLHIQTRGSLLSEMLCQFFPEKYPVLNGPINLWLTATNFKSPRGSGQGKKYIHLAMLMRSALAANPEHPAKNLAELDVIIQDKYRNITEKAAE